MRQAASTSVVESSSGWRAGARGRGRAARARDRRRRRTLKVGYVSPQTGPLAGFGESRRVRGRRRAQGGRQGPVDQGAARSPSRSSCATASRIPTAPPRSASRLILSDKVDLMLVASTPETTNPVSDQCEVNGTPVHLQRVPVAAVVLRARRQARHRLQVDLPLLLGPGGHHRRLPRHVELDPDQQGRRARSGPTTATATPGATRSAASRPRWPRPATSWSIPAATRTCPTTSPRRSRPSRTRRSRSSPGVPIPPDWTTFWKQAAQQGFQPKVASVGKALLFPRSVEALGDARRRHVHRGVVDAAASVQVVAHRRHRRPASPPRTRAETKKQWTQPLGFIHALFEVGLDALKRASSVDDKAAIVAAIKATNLNTIVGPISWAKGPVPNVTKTPLVGGQWVTAARTSASTWRSSATESAPNIPTAGHAAAARVGGAGPRSGDLDAGTARAPRRSPGLRLARRSSTGSARGRGGRGGRRHRPERRGQDDRAQPHGRPPAPDRGAVRLRRPRRHARCPRTRAAGPASRSPTRSPTPSRRMTVFENVLVGATYGGGRRRARGRRRRAWPRSS